MSNEPLVSIIVPSYNYAHLISKCIDSVFEQSFTNWELIIGDDRSQDHSLEILAKYQALPNVKVFVNETTLGIYDNIVKCLAQATGKFIKILMADDWLHPDYLTETLLLFEKYPSIGLCSVRTDAIDSNGKVYVTRAEPESGQIFYPSKEILNWTTRHVNPIGNPSRVIFRRDVYEQVGGFDLNIEYCTEYELWIRILEHWDCGFVPKTLSYELNHHQNATKAYVTSTKHILTGEQMFIKLFRQHSYFRDQWWRQQRVWLWGWKEYWSAALRHYLEGHSGEVRILVGVLHRNVPIFLWLPYLAGRFSRVALHRFRLRLFDIIKVSF